MTTELFEYAIEELAATRRAPVGRCKICGGDASPFDMLDFYKSGHTDLYPFGISGIPVVYRMCDKCQFVFTTFFDRFSPDQWQRYVYNDEYVKVDPDYRDVRPRMNARLLAALLHGRKDRVVGLDYGGGNGQAVTLLREDGWMFDTYDPFDRTDVSPERSGRYDFCSSFEVFEHSPDPIASLRDIVARTSPDRLMVLIGTRVHDGAVSRESRLSWWYAAPRNGHVSLFSRKSMQVMADACGLHYTPVRGLNGTHMLSRGISDAQARAMLLRGKARHMLRNALKR